MVVIRVQGKEAELADERIAQDRELAAEAGLELESKGAAAVVPLGRAGGQPVDLEVEEGDVLEYRDANGWVDFRSARSLVESAAVARGGVPGVIDLTAVLGPDPAAARGVRDIREVRAYTPKFPAEILDHINVLEALKGKVIDKAAQVAMREAAKAVVAWAERPRTGEDKARTAGVYRVGLDLQLTDAGRLRDGETLEGGDDAHLVLIHGTFSSTEGGFNKLRKEGEWAEIVERYDGRVAALEHKTLSVNPAQNALDLIRHLPERSTLHLVTHSRGGLVGEVLSLAAAGLLDEGRFVRDKRDDRFDAERALLVDLAAEAAQRQIQVERFVRVACPARGTILASPRLDSYIGFLLNVVEKIPGVSSLLFTILKTLVLAFLDQRTDPSVIPGLEAQMPDSPFIHMVNTSQGADDHLAAIVGDIEPGRWFKWLAIKATDLFYRQDHDLVVDSRSMYQGALRKDAVVSFHQGREVNHFSYFAEGESRRAMRNWLTYELGADLPPGFERLDRDAPKLVEPKVRRAVAEDAPVVVVVPGLMGTSLHKDGREVWPMAATLGTEGVGALAMAYGAAPGTLLGGTYQSLVDALSAEFQVEHFPYDWRAPMETTAALLRTKVDALLGGDRTVHIVAHSTGGLVVRQMLRGGEASSAWPGHANAGRILLLGCPNLGTYHALRLATGDADLVHRLHLLDPATSPKAIARQFRLFRSVLESFPHDGYFRTEEWWSRGDIQWGGVDDELSAAAAVAESTWEEGDGTIAIAGYGHPTASRATSGSFRYFATMAGDGVATLQSAAAHPGPTFSVEASHGELPSHPEILIAIVQLLKDGDTRYLEEGVPDGESEEVELPDAAARQLFPTSADLEAAALGRVETAAVAAKPVLRVEVVHGHLKHADYPVMVGHYDGSTLAGAENALDDALGKQLTDRDVLGVYPGRVGHAEVIAAPPDNKPPGGIVVGLGEIGAVNAVKVAQGVTEGALRHAIDTLSRLESAPHDDGETHEVGIAAVLVGTNGPAGLAVENAVAAIVNGIEDANRVLAERGLHQHVHIGHLQIVELFEDLAIEAAHAARKLHNERRRVGGDAALVAATELGVREGARRGQPSPSYQDGAWRPIMVESVHSAAPVARSGSGSPPAEAAGEGGEAPARPQARSLNRTDLAYTSIGLLARAEQTVHAGQRDLIDKLVAEAVGEQSPDDRVYNTLFEMLLPNSLKGLTRESDNLVLVVDAESAQYPWEMLGVRTRDGRIEPLSVQGGMLRRLLSPATADVVRATGNRALVVGDPPTGGWLPALDGAREEATAVANQLGGNAFEVTSLISDGRHAVDDMEVLNALFADEYRIIHFAAHGVYDPEDASQSGIIIGERSILTPLVLRQLRRIPPLVFLNCCHLGRLDRGDPEPLHGRYNHFAASVSQQLIESGVRAVVAGGWAVDDKAAKDFAVEFYTQMMAGAPFGDAVHRARRHIWTAHNHVNTWGAYQCYGDPGFKLFSKPQGGGDDLRFVAPVELRRRLDDMKSDAGGSLDSDGILKLRAAVRELLDRYPQNWRNGAVLNAAGACMAELGDFAGAVEFYRSALGSWKADAPFSLLEQLANLEGRLALQLVADDAAGRSEVRDLLRIAERRTKQLLDIAPTPERHRNFAAHYRRWALWYTGETDRRRALRNAADQYRQARTMHLPEHDPDSTINWGVFEFLSSFEDGVEAMSEETRREISVAVDACLEEAKRRVKSDPQFWNRVAEPDAALLRGLLAGDLGATAQAIAIAYSKTFADGSTARERASVISHLEFVRDMLAWLKEDELASAVGEVRRLIEVPEPDDGPKG